MSPPDDTPALRRSGLNAVLIVSARFVSDFGAYLNMVVLSTYVYLLSDSVMSVSIFLASRVAGGIVASLAGTPFFRRFHGRGSLIGFDVIRAALLVLLLFLPPPQQLFILPVIAFGIGLGNSMFAIGLNSQRPCWVHDTQRIPTNAWLTSLSATGAVAGSLVAGILVAASGYHVVFIVNILTYLAAALFIIPLRFITPPQAIPPGEKRNEWRALTAGLRGAPLLAGMLLVSMADTLGSAAHNVGFPIFSKLLTPDDAGKTMGLLLAVWAVGKFAGARLCARLLRNPGASANGNVFFAGVALMSVGFILTFQQSVLPWSLFFIIWAGVGDGIAQVSLISRVQDEPESLRLPVFSLLTLMQMTGFGIGMLIVAPFFVWMSSAWVILLFHGLPLGTLAGVIALRHKYRPAA